MAAAWMMRLCRRIGLGAAALVGASIVASIAPSSPPAGASTLAAVNGQGSTYAALAFQTWTESTQQQGLQVNYTATGSPAGLAAYQNNTADFAGTEAEYSELYADTPGGTPNTHVARGFAYTPDVAGAIAIMYHVAVTATGRDQVTYLHLSPLTIAKIFLGVIKNWDSPTISADNKGLVLPNKPITVVFRSGQSGTTALFYDFVKHVDPTDFDAWAAYCGYSSVIRVWEVDDCKLTAPYAHTVGQTGSDQQAQFVAAGTGLWSIAYDEFGYAKVYHDQVAWVENAAGNWEQPYALNIAAALQSAVLAPDTSQTLAGVYTSTNPLTYPISAYSYILYQCAPTTLRPTCKKPYASAGIVNTMAKFMRYIACTGQVRMATIGYSPLPTQLAQFMANAIGYMTGQPAETLTVQNCADPQFKGGNLGVGATPPTDPTAKVASLGHGAGGSAGSTGGASSTGSTSAGTSGNPHAAASGSTAATKSATGATGTSAGLLGLAAGTTGGAATASSIPPSPVAYVPPVPAAGSPLPLVELLLLLAIPVALLTFVGRRATPHGSGQRDRSGTRDDRGQAQTASGAQTAH